MSKVSSQQSLSAASVIVRRIEQVSADIEYMTAVMSVDIGKYFLLDTIGSVIWKQLEKPVSVSYLCEALVEKYDVTPETCSKDVLDFLTEALDHQLIRVVD